MTKVSHIKNESLKTILPDWKGNPVVDGKFVDLHKKFNGLFMNLLKWRFSKNEKQEEKKSETWRLKVRKENEFIQSTENCIVWLGHASFFLHLNGKRFLIDPVFGKISGLLKRYSEMPCAISDFRNIDYLLLSHAHRDHCDSPTLKKLIAQNNLTLLTSLNTGKLVANWVGGLKFQEAGWFQQFKLPEEKLTITFLPAQHWSNRFGWDFNKTLWGSFMIEADGLNIYFGGDSGYSVYPKQIAALFPHIDIAIIGAGAYTPDYMMKNVHTNPYEAVQVFHDLKAKTLIPMHYGTFDLADEPLGEPYRILKQLEEEKKINGQLRMLDVGEVFTV